MLRLPTVADSTLLTWLSTCWSSDYQCVGHVSVSSQLLKTESRISELERCDCRRRDCRVDGVSHRDGETWRREHCTECVCKVSRPPRPGPRARSDRAPGPPARPPEIPAMMTRRRSHINRPAINCAYVRKWPWLLHLVDIIIATGDRFYMHNGQGHRLSLILSAKYKIIL